MLIFTFTSCPTLEASQFCPTQLKHTNIISLTDQLLPSSFIASPTLHPPTLHPPSPISVSKQHAVIPSQVFELADSSSSYQDFSLTRNNRFSSTHSGRNIIQPPATVLHFYNAPPTLTQHQLHKLCTEHNVPAFSKFKVFDAKRDSKTLSGLLEFDSKTEAVEALTVLNHHQIRIPNSSNPFTLKLCFSTSSHL
uniref:Heterogeneous nuclear ribonucleoprotein L-like n=1 Tax=Seriola lalandi dorsalis TaxID=1841481 RepID=A0A3B4XMV9_SERLL